MGTKVAIGIGAVVVAVGILIGGWQLGWWAKSYAASRSAAIYQQSYGAQTADIQQLRQLMTEVAGIDAQVADPSTPASEVSALQSQRAAEINQACGVGALVSPTLLPSPEQHWIAANCG